ncbi:MAG: DUF420 domain-containing protein [Alphaproteobacteria bacterium]|nr:DUF420 domain-containing protein [Alphaproteobacteria bacterium]
METFMSGVLPHLTAGLNVAALILLLAGLVAVRGGHRERHRALMLSAVGVSGLFLAAYLLYHFTSPIFRFPGPDSMKPLYYALLISHVFLATAVLPFIAVTLRRALVGRFEAHKKLARFTLATWIYVSASGVAVYGLLYHVYTPASP